MSYSDFMKYFAFLSNMKWNIVQHFRMSFLARKHYPFSHYSQENIYWDSKKYFSGKTSLAQSLSTVASTAAFDKNPQSKGEIWNIVKELS